MNYNLFGIDLFSIFTLYILKSNKLCVLIGFIVIIKKNDIIPLILHFYL